MLRFNDGVNIDTSGDKLRILPLRDGLYVIGQGKCIPVNSYDEGKEVIAFYAPPKKES